MSYLKFHPQQLFTGTEMLESGHVLITDTSGTVEAIVPVTEAGEGVRDCKGVLTPGFINCHCHLELSHMKGTIPEKTGLVDFVFRVVTQRHFSEEAILEAIQQAEAAMIQDGIVAVGDICNNTHTLAQKQKARLAYYNFIEVSGWLPEVARIRFDRAKEIKEALDRIQKKTGNNRSSLSPHAPYSVSDPLWELLQPTFPRKTITIHNQETVFEDELFATGQGDFSRMYELMKLDTSFFSPPGKSSLQHYFDKLHAASQVLLVHNTFTPEADMVFVQAGSVSTNWCVCVNANQYIENALPPIDLLRKHNCSIVIGTDSLASNHSLSVLEEMKTIHRHFAHIPLEELLGWSSYNGAKALQMESELGSFAKGKTPGVNLLQGVHNGRIDSSTTITKLV